MHARLLTGLFMVLVVTLSGCGTAGHVRHHDPRFTHEGLVDGKLGVMGVTSRADPELSAIVGVRLGEDLGRVMSKERPDIDLEPVGTVREALGEDAHIDLLESLGRTPHREWDLEDLHRLVPGPEHWVLARIVEDEVIQSYASTFDDGVEDDPEFERWESTRRIRVVFYVYATTTRGVVFILSEEITEAKANSYEEYDDLLADLVLAAKTERTYPRPPTLASLMERTCLEFARSLP